MYLHTIRHNYIDGKGRVESRMSQEALYLNHLNKHQFIIFGYFYFGSTPGGRKRNAASAMPLCQVIKKLNSPCRNPSLFARKSISKRQEAQNF